MNINGATILVTGASRGLGRAIALDLAARGGTLALAARSEKDLDGVRAEIERAGGSAVAIPADVTVAEERTLLVKAAEAELGPIDILVNNAGIEHVSAFVDLSEDDIVRLIDVDLMSTLLLTRLLLPGMLARGSGQIVNIASAAGLAAAPLGSVYAAAKSGVVGWSHSLRIELRGTGVGVSVVCPGFVRNEGMFAEWATDGDITTMWLSGLLTTPKAVARSVARAIEKNAVEIVPSGPMAKLGALGWALSPRIAEEVTARAPTNAVARREARRRHKYSHPIGDDARSARGGSGRPT